MNLYLYIKVKCFTKHNQRMEKYQIIIFKNKKKLRVLKSYKSEKRALDFFHNEIKSNQEIKFDVKFKNANNSDYEIGFLVKNHIDKFFFKKDEYGRQNKIQISVGDYVLTKIENYKKEELIYDISNKKRIKFQTLIYQYLKKDNLKLVYQINNKLIIQIDNSFHFFSLKNEYDSRRLISCLSDYFKDHKRNDAIFIDDQSKLQKKYIYKLLKENNVDLRPFYRRFTTYGGN